MLTDRGRATVPYAFSMQPHGVIETCLYATDLDAAEAFYRDVLGLTLKNRLGSRMLIFHCGSGMLLIFNPELTSLGDTAPPHGATGAGHIAFRVKPDEFDGWRARLAAHGVPIESEMSWAEGGWSVYFRDPAGNSLEFTNAATWGLAE